MFGSKIKYKKIRKKNMERICISHSVKEETYILSLSCELKDRPNDLDDWSKIHMDPYNVEVKDFSLF